MSRRGWTWLTAAVTAAVIATVLALQEGGAPQDIPANVLWGDGPEAEPREEDAPEEAASFELAGAAAQAPATEEPLPGTPTRRAWLERAIRIAREERLAQASGEAKPAEGFSAPTVAGAAPEEQEDVGTLEPEYIRAAIEDLKPLLRDCYELALHEQADLQGRLVVQFEIVGEPDVGGIVETSAVDDTSTLRHPLLDECVRETMYVAELPAPEGGGRVTVRYPFTFSPE